MQWENINELCDIVRKTSFAIHAYHRSGHLEKVYERALANRLQKQGLRAEQQFPLAVYDEDGTTLLTLAWLMNPGRPTGARLSRQSGHGRPFNSHANINNPIGKRLLDGLEQAGDLGSGRIGPYEQVHVLGHVDKGR